MADIIKDSYSTDFSSCPMVLGRNSIGIMKFDEKSFVNFIPQFISKTSSLSITGQRLFRTILGLIKDEDMPGKTYTFRVSAYRNFFALSTDPSKQLLNAAKMLGTRFVVSDPANPARDGVVIGFIDFFRIKNGIAYVRVQSETHKLLKMLKPYTYSLGYIKKFRQAYSFPMYERCLMALNGERSASFYMSLAELWSFFGFGEHYIRNNGDFEYANFKRRVLKGIVSDINGEEGRTVCNIHLSFREEKYGTKVIGVYFDVSRVSSEIDRLSVFNPFYEHLSTVTKGYYDAALNLNIDADEIEKSILQYGEEGFCDVMRYVLKYHVEKGQKYITACIRNGWRDSDDQKRNSFTNLDKIYTLCSDSFRKYADFFKETSPERRTKIFLFICDKFKEEKPQLYYYMKKDSFDSILENEGFLSLVCEAFHDIVRNENPQLYYKWYKEWDSGSVISFAGRENIISVLAKENIVKTSLVADILKHSDDYILANIKYCNDKYRKLDKSKNISGAIVAAIREDYAGFNLSKRIREEEAEKFEQDKIIKASVESFNRNKDNMSDDELCAVNTEDNSALAELVKAEQESRASVAEKAELREYFLRLSEDEQNEIYQMALAGNKFVAERVKSFSYEEIWDSVYAGLFVKATKEFLSEHPLPSSSLTLEELDRSFRVNK